MLLREFSNEYAEIYKAELRHTETEIEEAVRARSFALDNNMPPNLYTKYINKKQKYLRELIRIKNEKDFISLQRLKTNLFEQLSENSNYQR